MKAIYKRELKSYFQSMTGYVLTAFMVIFTGIYFMAYNLNSGYPYFSYVLLSINYILIVAVPLLTMRSFAEERKSRTDQMLFTAPVHLWEVVLGKYLAMITVFAVPCVIFCTFPLIIKSFGTAYLKIDYLSILMFFLMGCVYIAIGMFLSSLTESQIIAAVTTFGALLLVFLWGGLMQFLPTSKSSGMIGVVILITLAVAAVYHMTKNWMIAGILEVIGVGTVIVTSFVKAELFENLLVNLMGKLYITEIFENIASNHLFDVSGLVMYLTLIAVFIFLTMQSIQKRRWS
ncbi:MAG: ABC transporter permease [Bariatricus sp.]|nr:ABC transporter permease [Bariatricus sp.]